MTEEKISITEDELDDAIYEVYKNYKYWNKLTHSEDLLVIEFAEFLMKKLFNELKEGIKND